MKKESSTSVALLLEKERHAYCHTGIHTMSDEKTAELEKHIAETDPSSHYIAQVGIGKNKNKVRHTVRMLPIPETNSLEGLVFWKTESIRRLNTNHTTMCIIPKIDGIEASLIYRMGRLKSIALRGDSYVGRNITHLKEYIKTIPKSLPEEHAYNCEVRGVLVVPKNTEVPHMNRKSYCSGLLRRTAHGLDEVSSVRFIAQELMNPTHAAMRVDDDYSMLEELNFDTTPYIMFDGKDIPFISKYVDIVRDGMPMIDLLKEIASTPQSACTITIPNHVYDYETSGLIYRFRNKEDWIELDKGSVTAKSHDYEMALVPPPAGKQTNVMSLAWKANRASKLTPTVNVHPIKLDGLNISSVALDGLLTLKKLKVKVGDLIEVTTTPSGIPLLKGNESGLTRKDFKLKTAVPRKCPYCGAGTKIRDDNLYCTGSEKCKGVQRFLIEYWCAYHNIPLLGRRASKSLKKLMDADLIKSLQDLYTLDIEKVREISKLIGDKNTKKIQEAIDRTRSMKWIDFWLGLGVTGLNKNTSQGFDIRIDSNGFTVDRSSQSYKVENPHVFAWVEKNTKIIKMMSEVLTLK